jgi:hypothetical protein
LIGSGNVGINNPFFASGCIHAEGGASALAQTLPYQALSQAPKDIRSTAKLALIANSISHVTSIFLAAIIISLLPSWFPGLLQLQVFSVALLVLLLGSILVSRKGSHVREWVASREIERARGSAFSAAILGFIVGGVASGIVYLYLCSRINGIQQQPPSEFRTVYLLPQGSNGVFLGRYFGWGIAYLFVLYVGYTQLPSGLREVSNWLSPVFGTHFNTIIVAAYLVFANPLTNPQLFQLWVYAGLLGGLIAGGRISRGHMVALSVFLSTLGAIGLAGLAIARSLTLANLPHVPGPPPGFSLTDAATGPVAADILPLFLAAPSLNDPAFLQQVMLVLARNAGLIFMIVTISGRVASLAWQGGVDTIRFLAVTLNKQIRLKNRRTTLDRPGLKAAIIILLMVIPVLVTPTNTYSGPATLYAPPVSGPYQQNLAVGLDMLGSPNASLRMTNLDLSGKGLVKDSNYAGSQIAAFIINQNYDLQSLGNKIPGGQMLQFVSQPALVTFYQGTASSSAIQSGAVSAQFSQALGVTMTPVLVISMNQGTMRLYAPNPQLSNNDAMARVQALLPGSSFSSLVNSATVTSLQYFVMIGVVPSPSPTIPVSGISFVMNLQWPRMFYKQGPHFLSLRNLLGFQNAIAGDPAANVSIINMSFKPGTILYSSLFPNPFYNNSTSTYILNAQSGSRSDFTANFTYPFAPKILIQKTITPSSGPVKTTYHVTVYIQNQDTVAVTGINVTDTEASTDYRKTLQLNPDQTQSLQLASFASGNFQSFNYSLVPSSSGTYVLTPATVSFTWKAPNGTTIRYMINTGIVTLTSSSGLLTHFTSSFNDLYPYSLLLILPLTLTPVLETVRLVGRQWKKHHRSKMEAKFQQQQSSPPQPSSIPPSPHAGADDPSAAYTSPKTAP